jgi:enoyl-CoA hydratase/carnithine racemase
MTDRKQRGGGDPGGIKVERRGAIFLIGLDRPKKLNGLSPKMLRELAEAFTAYEADGDARCAVLYGEGGNTTAGLDLSMVDIEAEFFPAGTVDPFNRHDPVRSKPVVCAVEGICYTAGIELMLAADIVVAAKSTRFSQLEVKRGLLATGGATIRMVQSAGWGNAMAVLLTGDEFDSATALRFGFIQEVVADGEARGRAIEIAETIAAQAPLAVKATIEAARQALFEGPAAAIAGDKARWAMLSKTEDVAEGIASFKERRPPVYKGR